MSAFGPRVPIAKAEETLLRDFAAVLTTAMLRAKVKRVIVESTAFLFKNSVFLPLRSLENCYFRALWWMPARWAPSPIRILYPARSCGRLLLENS